MATTTVSYGSITLTDITDIGELSIYPKSNLPQSIIYSPDQNSFTPNWGSNNLILSPSIWYGGEQLSTSDNNVTVTWSRREGIGAVTALTTGETISDGTMEVGGETIPKGTLVVNQNKFTENSTMITYIVAVSYQEPTISQALTAQGEITFTMTKQASSVKSATITGESVFKYNGDGTIKGASTITLNGRVTGSGVNISAWQYQQSNGSWATYPNSGTSPTLTVNESHSVFTNDKCVIKLVTTNNDIYDYHTITKLRDGAAGTDTISAVLTNEDQMIPVNSSGVADYSDAVSRIIIYESGEDVTSQWSINVSYDSNNLTVNTSTTTVANDTVAITNMVGSTGTINFTATKNGHDPILKQFSVIKIESGADGQSPIIYSLEPSTLALNKTIGNTPTFTPASVRFYSYQTQNQTKTIYKGRFKIYENVLAKDITSSTEAKYTSSSDENDGYHDYTPVTGKNCTSIVCVLFESGGTSKQLDIQTIAVTTDGQTGGKGDKGDDGTDALNIIVGNSYDGIPVDGDGKVASTYTILIPFAGYQGTAKVATTVVNPPTLFGITPTVTNATTSADGSIQYVITAGTTITNDNGIITFTFKFTEANKTVTYDYSWGKARQGKDGTSISITSTSVTYQEGTNGTVQPTGTWETNIPTVAQDNFLWTKTVVNYSDGSSTESYSVSRNAVNGTNGTSPTVSSTVTEYTQTTSGTTTPTSGWNTTPPSAIAGRYMWTKVTVTYSDGATAVSYTVSKNGTNGNNGINTATVYLYKRGDEVPSTPSGTTTYTFSTKKLTGTLDNWSQTIPTTGDGECYVIAAVASSSGTTDTIATGEWSTPIQFNGTNGTNGDNGLNQATIFLYKRGTSVTKPTTSVTYTFSTGALSAEPNSWKRNIPTIDGNPCWVVSATAISNDTSVTITGSNWSDPVKLVEDGKDGGKWYSGTSITGTSTTATVFSGSGISSAVEGDMYLNTSTYNTYRCTLGGDASTAKWVYVNNIKGVHGDTGKGVSSITNQYYLSTSNTTQTGGSWSSTVPSYVEDCYYWTKSHIVWTDNTETDTTAVLDNGLTDANANAIDARKVATNYLAVDNTGIMVANMKDGEQLPSKATGRNVFIDNDSVDIRNGQRVLASFSGEDTKFYDVNSDNKEVASFGANGVRVGNEDEQHFIVDSESMQAINENGSPIFSVTSTGGTIISGVVVAKGFNSQASDYDVILNGGISSSENTFYPKDLYAFITIQNSRSEFTSFEVSINDGEFEDVPFTRTSYTPEDSKLVVRSRHHVDLPRFLFHYGTSERISYQLEGVYTSDKGNTYRYSGDIHISYDGQRTITMEPYHDYFLKTSGDAEDNTDITNLNGYLWGDIYSSLGYTKAPAMTFGTRGNGGTIAPLSVAIGQDLYANNENQLSIGKYNLQNNDGLAFVIGNGTDDANRSNAFTVNWDGNTEVGGDLEVANNAEIVNDINVGGDVNIAGAIKSNNKPMFKVVNRAFTSIGIKSGKAYTTKRTISIDGYTPVSIGGIKVTNNMAYNASSYADASWCVVPAFWIDFSDTIDDPNIRTDALYFYIWNMNSSKGVNVDFNVRIVYIATDALGQ